MSSNPPERRPAGTSTSSSAGPSTGPTSPVRPGDPEATSRFRPFGSSSPSSTGTQTTATPVTRDRADGTSSTAEWEDPEDTGPERLRHVVDRFDGAAGLLVLRVVTAVILAIHGLQILQHLDVARLDLSQGGVPNADVLAVVIGSVLFASAFLLIIGALVRVVGLVVAALCIGSLVYFKWRSGDIFTDGQPGFRGDFELLATGVGLALAGLGGGGWGVDRRFRRR